VEAMHLCIANARTEIGAEFRPETLQSTAGDLRTGPDERFRGRDARRLPAYSP